MKLHILPTYLLFLAFGVIISYISNSLLLRFSQSLGIRNKNDVTVRWANESKPSLGGIGLFAAFFFGTIAFAVVYNQENIFQNKQFVGLISAATLAFIMGIADDAYNTRPFAKLFVQIACGVILCYTHTTINLFSLPWVNYLLTILWVVGIMNSLNMLDNMDGITGTTAFFIVLSCFVSNGILNGWNSSIWTAVLLIQMGAILGFLKFNVFPSRLFMGDAGSQFIGLFVAFLSIQNLWNIGNETQLNPLVGGFITLIAFTPTLVDTLTVVINRLKQGRSPMVGGKDHTTHHLVYKGLTDRQVWFVFFAIGVGSCVLSVLSIYFSTKGQQYIPFICTLYFFIIFIYLYRNTIIHKK